VLPIKLPPLREHPEDIPIIANHLLEKHCVKLNKPPKKISPELMEVFVKRTWDGNVRELENVIMQGILFSTTDEIRPQNIDLVKRNTTANAGEMAPTNLPYKEAKEKTLVRFNQEYLSRLLSENQGNVSRAARQCGLERQALQQIMRRYDIRAGRYRV